MPYLSLKTRLKTKLLPSKNYLLSISLLTIKNLIRVPSFISYFAVLIYNQQTNQLAEIICNSFDLTCILRIFIFLANFFLKKNLTISIKKINFDITKFFF